ncbi:hypothetical protein ACLQ3K_21990 [Tsukamurella sp. DT100]|uniref:hypothetical protein n=1 Tax=Tsukamurella sp. DT100 TaxID=3393415 RepID=UPI003CF5F478
MIVLQILAGAAAFLLACAVLAAIIHHLYRCTWPEAAFLTAAVLLVFGALTGIGLAGGAS